MRMSAPAVRLSLRLGLQALALPVALAGCADANEKTQPATAVGPDYGNRPIPGGDASPLTGDAGPDARRPDASALGGLNEPCARNTDCQSGWCIQAAPDQPAVCTSTCLDETSCPEGWDCRVVANTPPDVVSLCFPPVMSPPDAGPDAALSPPDAEVPPLDMMVFVPDLRLPDPDMLVIADMRMLAIDAGPVDGPPPPPPADMRVPPPPTDAAPPPPPDAAPPPPPDVPTAPPPPPDAAPPPPPDMPTAPPPPPDAAPPIPDVAPPIPDAALPPLKGYGEPCARGGECQSGLCVGDPINGGGFCTQACVRDNACPNLDVCRPAGGGVSVCFRNETGQPCNLPNDCTDGICLTPPDGLPWANVQNVCINRCDADSKCPSGYTCENIQTNLGVVRACNVNVRRLDTCPGGIINACLNSGTCVIPPGRQAIDIYQCIGTVDLPDGYCSCSCANATHCPAGFGCYREPRLVLSGDAARPGLCLAFAGYRCPVGASNPNNPAAEQCPSFTCVTPDSGAFDAYCSSPCLADSDCPAEFICDVALGGCVAAQ
jgi:hypothetical protein